MAIEIIEGQKKIITLALLITILSSAVCYNVFNIHISAGIFAGFAVSLVNYYLLNLTVEKGAQLSKKIYQIITVVSFFVRFTLLAYLIFLSLTYFGKSFVLAGLGGMFILKGMFFIFYIKTLFSASDKKF